MDPLLLLVLVGIVILILAAVPAQSQPEHIVVVVPQERPTFGCTFLILLFLFIIAALISAGR
jgi:hypothetical protein